MHVALQMSSVAWWFVLALAILQSAFMVMEMGFWHFMATHVAGYKEPVVSATRALGANMGLYNGFLAAGLLWSLRAPQGFDAELALFFVGCVLAAGLFGLTVSWRIVAAQAIPAACALVALLIHWSPK